MADRDNTAPHDRWNMAGDDESRINNVISDVIADNLEYAINEAVEGFRVFVHSHPETGEPSIMYGFATEPFDKSPDTFVPISKILWDAEPVLLEKITALLKQYCDR